ncbi:restriction endonuclease [Pseudomonas sp. 22-AL-CL-001]|uniref:restriction endonuclease n=1 Tax=Pseudomonas alabamensis TaxID=3064349 RepID=UPI002714197E|nr:restriction endonuclease [Pseudomonas sp. 22-AL-CL-001]MDO7908949.1 restriction endonuclease [Pseudomonas sp. 22-AL-CL-001]
MWQIAKVSVLGRTMTTISPDWIIPSAIPFEHLKAKDLEECLFWLLDAMGAQNIEWRIGGTGGGAPDGGRDLEAQILVPSSDGDLSLRTFWFECKGRKNTVPPEVVRNAATHASAYSHVDTLVVVTNSTFSNPTTDWVRDWNNDPRPRAKVQLWDRTKLEQMLCRHPSVALRLFDRSLSLDGRLQALTTRFWERFEYTPIRLLEELWDAREKLEIAPIQRFALIANECSNRSLELRPWATATSPEQAFRTLEIALANLYYLFLKVIRNGVNDAPIFKALSHLILIVLRDYSAELVCELLKAFASGWASKPMPEDVLEIVLEPVLRYVNQELTSICVPQCTRVSRLARDERMGDDHDIATYWYRFEQEGYPRGEDEQILWFERTTEPCAVGLSIHPEKSCPLSEADVSLKNLENFLQIAKQIFTYRMDCWQKSQAEKAAR